MDGQVAAAGEDRVSLALAADRTVVGRLRIRPGGADPMLARMRAATLLSSAALTPVGLPPAAILVVRRLSDPMPGRLGLRGGSMRLPHEWEREVRARMDAIARSALRPAREAVGEAAEAVLFADYAELLACLARDWMRGALQRWWWRTLFPRAEAAAAVPRAWLEGPECVPAAMAQLAAKGDEAAFVSRLGRQGAHQLLQSVLAAYSLQELRKALQTLHSTGPHVAHEPAREQQPEIRRRAEVVPPWRRGRAGEEVSDAVAEALAGVCRTLQQAPQLARSRPFVARAKEWAEMQAAAPVDAQEVRHRSVARVEIPASAGGSPRSDAPRAEHPEEIRQVPDAARLQRQPPAALARQPASLPTGAAHEETRVETSEARSAHEERLEWASLPSLEALRIETQFGGVFFLVNLALLLGFYGDFTKPARRVLSLALWDFVAMVGERLAGTALRDDPVWALLAHLAGRQEGDEPGGGLPSRRRAALERWLGRLLPRLRARLEQALGPDAAAVLVCLPARVWLTPTRLDVGFTLADLPVAVRLSGLDRDPGWVPAAGRSLRFHFD